MYYYLFYCNRSRLNFRVHRLNWINGEPKELSSRPIELDMKLRHGPTIVKGVVRRHLNEDLLAIELFQKDKGIAPGQFAAFYQNEVCIGAGVIYDTAADDIL